MRNYHGDASSDIAAAGQSCVSDFDARYIGDCVPWTRLQHTDLQAEIPSPWAGFFGFVGAVGKQSSDEYCQDACNRSIGEELCSQNSNARDECVHERCHGRRLPVQSGNENLCKTPLENGRIMGSRGGRSRRDCDEV